MISKTVGKKPRIYVRVGIIELCEADKMETINPRSLNEISLEWLNAQAGLKTSN